jgi:hypothetical protein
MKRIILASLAMLFYTTAAFAGLFNDNHDGTVTDFTTKLMWQQCSAGQSGTNCAAGSAGVFTWANAISHCEAASDGGFSDWRLPNFRELQSLTDMTTYNPAINASFPATPTYLPGLPGTLTSPYWSSTTYANSTTTAWIAENSTTNAWIVDFSNGMTYGSYSSCAKSNSKFVRCVRGRSLGSFVKLMRGSNPVHTYSTFHEAYAAALGGDTIQAQAVASNENLVFASSSDIHVWLKGGYDNGFTANSGFTTFGGLTISRGSVTIEKVKLK